MVLCVDKDDAKRNFSRVAKTIHKKPFQNICNAIWTIYVSTSTYLFQYSKGLQEDNRLILTKNTLLFYFNIIITQLLGYISLLLYKYIYVKK